MGCLQLFIFVKKHKVIPNEKYSLDPVCTSFMTWCNVCRLYKLNVRIGKMRLRTDRHMVRDYRNETYSD